MTEAAIRKCVFRHDARNLQLQRRLVERGIDCRVQSRIECHFWAPNEDHAARLGEELARRGFRILALRPAAAGAKHWNLEAEITQSIAQTVSHEFTEEMVCFADALSCVYDGWGTSIPSQV